METMTPAVLNKILTIKLSLPSLAPMLFFLVEEVIAVLAAFFLTLLAEAVVVPLGFMLILLDSGAFFTSEVSDRGDIVAVVFAPVKGV